MKFLALIIACICMGLSLYHYIAEDLRNMIFFGILAMWNMGNLILASIGEKK